MDVELTAEQRTAIVTDIQAFFREERDEEIGIVATERVLQFFLDTTAKRIYNAALDDAKTWLHKRAGRPRLRVRPAVRGLTDDVADTTASRVLSADDKRALFRDGYLILRGAVPPHVVAAARERIVAAGDDDSLGRDRTMTDLVNESAITPLLTEAMGQFDPPSECMPAVRPITAPADRFNPVDYRDRDVPFFGTTLHVDGVLTINAPQEPQLGSADEIYRRYIGSGPRGDLGRSADVLGHNHTPLFQDPEMTLGVGSFTAFAFVALSDQTEPGCGQTSVLPGAHHHLEKFFRWQRQTDGRLGPEGPGWPRLDHDCPNRCGLVYTPAAVIEPFLDSTAGETPDGRRWPRPLQLLMEPGDAAICMWHLPHSASRNERGTEPRATAVFRLRNKRRQPRKLVAGNSDHPDRGWDGEFLDYEADNDPWERSRDAICDMWREWEGMQQVVAEAQGG